MVKSNVSPPISFFDKAKYKKSLFKNNYMNIKNIHDSYRVQFDNARRFSKYSCNLIIDCAAAETLLTELKKHNETGNYVLDIKNCKYYNKDVDITSLSVSKNASIFNITYNNVIYKIPSVELCVIGTRQTPGGCINNIITSSETKTKIQTRDDWVPRLLQTGQGQD